MGALFTRILRLAIMSCAAWGACGAFSTAGFSALADTGALEAKGQVRRVVTSFEGERGGFSAGEPVRRHATDGEWSLRLGRGYTSLDRRMDWRGFDYLKADIYNESQEPADFYVEIRDDKTTGYWTRVNYHTIVPPGKSTVIVPTDIYVGEKSRPGRRLDTGAVTRLVFSIGAAAAAVYIDNVRLERDDSAREVQFDGLWAFDLGTATSPLMEGFTKLTPDDIYTAERGWGLKNAQVWRAFDVLQPEPLYQDFICIQSGGVAIDLPNGRYRVFLNIDNPSGYWGEYQVYRQRKVIAQGEVVWHDEMDFESFMQKYYRFWDTEDLPSDDTFAKYQDAYFQEKEFEAEVTNGRLSIEFEGSAWAVSLSALVVYPVERATEGQRFLEYVRERRRFHFENYFRRILRDGTHGDFEPTRAQRDAGFVVFRRSYMEDVNYNDKPRAGEVAEDLSGFSFAGTFEPVTFSILPLEDLGEISVEVSDLVGEDAQIASDQFDIGFVSYRLSRVRMDGSVYTIAPRLIMPSAVVNAPAGLTRRFWLTLHVPETALPGVYRATVTLSTRRGTLTRLPLAFTVMPGTLDEADVPAGPWGHTINTPWYADDPAARDWNDKMARKSLRKLREAGFTSFSGMPVVTYRGFRDGRPVFDFTQADAQMKMAREAGFSMPIINYARFNGLNLYYKDTRAMEAAGFSDYSEFIRALFQPLQEHAEKAGWLPVYWNLGDEPIGDDLFASIDNARAYTRAFPDGPPYFTLATSVRTADPDEPHQQLASSVHMANVNIHSEDAVRLIGDSGRDWAFYNGANRWTYGIYMYKAVREFDMKMRLTWHWNIVAGDPYYALDCREDDYAWHNSCPDGRLIPSLMFERNREGLYDYRMLITIERLAREKAPSRQSRAAEDFIDNMMSSFSLGQRSHEVLFDVEGWDLFRREAAEIITALRGL